MASLIPGYEYDIFISYRQKDNKYDGWVTEFVDNLKRELEATFKEDVSVYFDINPHDGLLETHDVDASLKDKLNCLVFIPIISRTYCDPKSFAWEHEFKAFVEEASKDQFGLKVKLPNGNVASRVLPIQIHDLDVDDKKLIEIELGGFLRGIEFIYKEPGVNRPLMVNEDQPDNNLNKTFYRNQINKVSNAVKEITTAIRKHNQQVGEISKEIIKETPERPKKLNQKVIIVSFCVLALIALGYFFLPKIFKSSNSIEKSIAVLPFINDSPNDSTTYFIDGVMEEILTDLQMIKDIRVISRTSVEQFRGPAKPTTPEIAKKLGVNYIVEGSGQKYGNTFRLRVQLIRAAKESHLWAKSYEKEIKYAKDIFSIQSEIAQAIAAQLEAAITPQEKQIIQKTPTSNLDAYNAYLQGIFYFTKFTKVDEEVALQYFEQAIEKDPGYALAYAGICRAWIFSAMQSFTTPEEAYPKAIAAFTKAFELDSTRVEVYQALASIQLFIKWNWVGADAAIKKAIALNPNDVYTLDYYACLLDIIGRKEEAIEQEELAIKLDPLNVGLRADYGLFLSIACRYDDAIKTFQAVIKIDPANTVALGLLPSTFHQIGRYKEELEAWKSYLSIAYKDFITFNDVAQIFDLGYTKGGFAGALNLEADTLVAQSKTHFILPFDIAILYACAGNKERTMDMMERDYEVHDFNFPFMAVYPVFESMHSEPRFCNLFCKINLPCK
jgi:TolB-like protein